nr:SpoIIE family protein phosphatase [Streptomyces sp. SM11]
MPHRQRRAPSPDPLPPRTPARSAPLPTGAPLGVGGVDFDTTTVPLHPGDQLLLNTDGPVATTPSTNASGFSSAPSDPRRHLRPARRHHAPAGQP